MSTVTKSSGNVFADIGVSDPEGALVKAKLASRIIDIIGEREWTQARAAAILGIDQPRVSDIVRGSLSRFSTDLLMLFVARLGTDVTIELKPRRRGAGHVSVVAV